MAALKAVKKTDLPKEWLKEAPAETLEAFGKMLDCPPSEIHSHTMWSMPETPLAFNYQNFLMKNNDPEQVGLMMQCFDTWTTYYGGDGVAAKERVIHELLENFKATGHPKHLCRCFGRRLTTAEDEDPIESTPSEARGQTSSGADDDPIESTQPSETQQLEVDTNPKARKLGRGRTANSGKGKA